jgi:pimeloyl-ACP methyl ester carboxylesterase
LPRNREPLLHLIRNTTLMKDYEVVGDMTLDAVRTIQTPTLLVYGRDSHFISSYDFLHQALPNCKPCCCRAASISARWSSPSC